MVALAEPPQSRAADPAEGAPPALPMLVVGRSRVPVQVGSPPARFGRMLRPLRFAPLIWLVFAAGGVVGLYVQPPGLQMFMRLVGLQPGGGTSNPIAVPAPKLPERNLAPTQKMVAALGRLTPENDVITIAPPYGAGDARIAALAVREGERVEKGQVLAILDNEEPLKAALESARATLGVREAALAQVRSATEASRNEARAALARAEAAAANAAREFERADELRRRGVVTEVTYDQRRTARDQTLRYVEAARATLSRYDGTSADMQPDVIVARRNVEAARAELARAESDLDKAYVRAPLAGTVLTIHVRAGEKPGTKGLMNLGDLTRMTAELEVYQTQIGQVAVGDAVTITAEALPRPLAGQVTRIGLEVQRQALVDPSPAANTDARVVKVYVRLDPESAAIAARYTNLQVTGRIAVGAAP